MSTRQRWMKDLRWVDFHWELKYNLFLSSLHHGGTIPSHSVALKVVQIGPNLFEKQADVITCRDQDQRILMTFNDNSF